MAIVLKSQTPSDKTPAARSVSGLAGFNLTDLADEGRQRLEQCRQQVRQMLDEAKQQAEEIRREAQVKGYEQGRKEALADADRKIAEEAKVRAKDGLQIIHQAVEKLHVSHQQWMDRYAESLHTIALAAAQRVCRHRLEQEPDLIVQWADEALRSTRSATSLTLVVHPEILAQLGPALDEILAAPGLPEQTHVEADESVPRGEVVVRQPGGEIRAGLQAQLLRLEELLK